MRLCLDRELVLVSKEIVAERFGRREQLPVDPIDPREDVALVGGGPRSGGEAHVVPAVVVASIAHARSPRW